MNIQFKGFVELKKDFENISTKVKSLEGSSHVKWGEIFSDSFMKKNTEFDSVEAFLRSTGLKVESKIDFEAIPDNDLDLCVKNNTRFNNWEDMLGNASDEYLFKKIGI